MFRVVQGFGKIAGVAVVGVVLVGRARSDVHVPSWSVLCDERGMCEYSFW